MKYRFDSCWRYQPRPPLRRKGGFFLPGAQFKCLPARQSGRLFAQGANERLGPTPPDALDLAQPKRTGACSRRPLFTTFGRAGAALPRAFPMRAQPDAMTRKPCPPPTPRGSNASRRKNRRMRRSPFPPAPLFSRPLFLSLHSVPPPSFCWTLRLGPSMGNTLLGAAPLGSSDGGTPPADHRSCPTSWRKARRVSRTAFANQQRGINAANEAALGPGHAALTVPIRSAPARASLNAGRLAPSAPFSDPIQRRLGARRGGALSRGGDEEE